MRDLNKVILLGRLGQDPEIRNLQSGATVCNLSVATSVFNKNKPNNIQTVWHKIVTFEQNVIEYCQKNFAKGDTVYVEGRLNYRTVNNEDSVSGKASQITEIVIGRFDGVIRLFSKKKTENSEHNQDGEIKEDMIDEISDDEIPF